MPISPQAPARPRGARAWSTEACSSARIERAARFIQKTMPTSTATATNPISASNSSCMRCGNCACASCRAAPANSASATARNTPTQIAGSHSPRPVWRRYPAMMPTIRAASSPSRSMIRNGASIGPPSNVVVRSGVRRQTGIAAAGRPGRQG